MERLSSQLGVALLHLCLCRVTARRTGSRRIGRSQRIAGSRRTAARVTFGAICLNNSSHLPHKLYSNVMNPVALPPGRARLSTKPTLTGSTTITKTIGIVWVACSDRRHSSAARDEDDHPGRARPDSAAYLSSVGDVGAWPAIVDLYVSAFDLAGSAAALEETQPYALAPRGSSADRCQQRASRYGANGPAAARAPASGHVAAPPSVGEECTPSDAGDHDTCPLGDRLPCSGKTSMLRCWRQ